MERTEEALDRAIAADPDFALAYIASARIVPVEFFRAKSRFIAKSQEIRKLLSQYSPETVSLYFLRASFAFDPPETLEQAQLSMNTTVLMSLILRKCIRPGNRPDQVLQADLMLL